MAIYTFKAFDKEFITKAEGFDMFDEMGKAMTTANQNFLWKLPEFISDSNGEWVANGDCNYVWQTGNFFD